jgi:hypothetical protein
VITVPEGHGEGIKILEDGSQRCEPLCSQDHIVASEGQGEEIPGERLVVNGERRATVHARARDVVTVGHRNLQFAPGSKLERGAGGRLLGDEIVGGAGVEEGKEGDATELDAHLHHLTGADAGDHVDRDLWLVGGRLVRPGVPLVVLERQVEEEDSLADTVVAASEFLVAIEAEAQAVSLLHLCLGQALDRAPLYRHRCRLGSS